MFEARESVLESITWDGEDRATIESDGWTFAGAKRKDFFCPEDDWESRLVPGVKLRFWSIQFSRIAGFEWWDGGRWQAVWFCGNDFQPKAERDASAAAYDQFIENEGGVIAKLIDEGKSLAEINELIDDGHSGNTYGCALHLGIHGAANRENAERVRMEHNAKYGQPEAKGTINPALLTILVKGASMDAREALVAALRAMPFTQQDHWTDAQLLALIPEEARLTLLGRAKMEQELLAEGYHEGRQEAFDLLETAWGIIANASGGAWERESAEWRQAAGQWRENYHRALAAREGSAETYGTSPGKGNVSRADSPSASAPFPPFSPERERWEGAIAGARVVRDAILHAVEDHPTVIRVEFDDTQLAAILRRAREEKRDA